MNMYGLLLAKKLSGGGGGSSTLVEKTITANGTYNPADDNADGYSSVTANVPNTYTVADEGKVVDSGALVGQTAKNIDANGLYDTTLNNSVSVDVPNSYTVADEGKVVSSGALVSQTAYPSTIVANGTYDTTLNNSVTVDVPPVGVVVEKDVNFYDYDGTLVYSYTAQEFLALTDMPANPTHTGLTAQGWNWSLTDAKTYVTSYSKLDIGQMYITDDGKTRLHLNITADTLNPYVAWCYPTGVTDYDVDWGDGSEHSVGSSAYPKVTHTYSSPGQYVVTITNGKSGRFAFYGSANYLGYLISDGTTDNSDTNKLYHYTLYKIELGDVSPSVFYNSAIGVQVLSGCSALKYISIPSNVTTLGDRSFRDCAQLRHITIPNGVTIINDNMFQYLHRLASVSMPCTIKTIGASAFDGCNSLKSVTIPSRVTSIVRYAFNNCNSLPSVTIPSSVTSIGTSAFQYCYLLAYIDIDKPTNSISGSPWGAPVAYPNYIQIIWHD